MPSTILNHPHQLFAPAEAERLAAQLNAEPGEDWIYTAVHCPQGTGYSFITLHDAEHEYIGRL